MLIDENVVNTKKLMSKISSDEREEIRNNQEDIKICKELKKMNREAKSIQRSKDINRIRRFNDLFFKKTKRLTELRTNQSTTKQKEVSKLINEWRKNN